MFYSQSGKDYRPPEKFDHFEVVTLQKDENGDFSRKER